MQMLWNRTNAIVLWNDSSFMSRKLLGIIYDILIDGRSNEMSNRPSAHSQPSVIFVHVTSFSASDWFGATKAAVSTKHLYKRWTRVKNLLIIPLIVAKAAITYLNIQSHFGKNMNLVKVALQYSKTIIPKKAFQTF